MDNQHTCKNHPVAPATAQCCVCGEWFCADCIATVVDKGSQNRIISEGRKVPRFAHPGFLRKEILQCSCDIPVAVNTLRHI